jgi:alkanesulfonate monooxygenase SsuD/methylene tetrahydromethanopterin reductase-like flavin-dependent oxidoreductase (luciferase family)
VPTGAGASTHPRNSASRPFVCRAGSPPRSAKAAAAQLLVLLTWNATSNWSHGSGSQSGHALRAAISL